VLLDVCKYGLAITLVRMGLHCRKREGCLKFVLLPFGMAEDVTGTGAGGAGWRDHRFPVQCSDGLEPVHGLLFTSVIIL